MPHQDLHFFDAGAVHAHNFEVMAVPIQRFSGAGDVLHELQQEACQGVVAIGFGQLQPQLAVEFKDLQVACHQPTVGAQGLEVGGAAVVF